MKINLKSAIGFGAIALTPFTTVHNSEKSEKPKPNVIFILLDDFGYADLGCYGSRYYKTPNIDRLARGGIRFTNAYAACPVSSPTRASIMTGRYPVNTGIIAWIPARKAPNRVSPNKNVFAL